LSNLRPFEELKRLYRKSFLIGCASVGTVPLLSVAALWLHKAYCAEPAGGAFTGAARVVLMIFSLGELIAVPMIQRMFLKPAQIKGAVYHHDHLWPGYNRSLFRTSILTYAICEMPVVFGLFLYLLTRQLGDYFLFASIAVVAYTLYFPRYEQWEYELRKMN